MNSTINKNQPTIFVFMRALILFMAISFLFGCDDDEEGALAEPGTMKMTLNGEVKVSPKSKLPYVSYHPGTEFLGIIAYFSIPSSTEYRTMHLNIYNPKDPKIDLLGGGYVAGNSSVLYMTPDSNKAYVSNLVNETNVGKIKLTKFDIMGKLVSGTFEVKLADGTGQVLVVTNGSFTNLAID